MEIVKSLWQRLQDSKSEYKQLSVEELKSALNNIYNDRKEPIDFIPGYFVLSLSDNDFNSFMKTKNNYRITCNNEQYELIQKRIDGIRKD